MEKVTDNNGYASVQLNLNKAHDYTVFVTFLGDNDYNASMVIYLIKINKKPIKISVSAKKYKAKAKTKKFTVILKSTKKCIFRW